MLTERLPSCQCSRKTYQKKQPSRKIDNHDIVIRPIFRTQKKNMITKGVFVYSRLREKVGFDEMS